MDFNSFKTDASMENEGVWRKCGSGEILIASSSSDRYKKVLKRLLAPHEMALALNAVEDKDLEAIGLESIAEGLLIDWKGFTEDGKECPYSKENALRLLKDAPRFRQFVEKEASNIENFRRKKDEAEAKN